MTKIKLKMMVVLTAICCVFAIFGISVSVWHKTKNAKAEADVTYSGVTVVDDANKTDQKCVYFTTTESFAGFTAWEHFKINSDGSGFVYNDEVLADYTLQLVVNDGATETTQNNEWYIAFGGKEATSGDEVVIDGKFKAESSDVYVIFDRVGFCYDGGTWSTFEAYERYSITKLTPESTSSTTEIKASVGAGDEPIESSDEYSLTLKTGTGNGLLLNGQSNDGLQLVQKGTGFVVKASENAIAVGTVLTIDGVFYNETLKAKFAFTNCSMAYLSTGWSAYDVYFISSLSVNTESPNTTAKAIDAGAVDVTLPIHENEEEGWGKTFTFDEGSGEGFLFNYKTYSGWGLKQPGSFCFDLGKDASNGDEVVLDGVFYNEDWKILFAFDHCGLCYNGTTWESFKAHTTHQLGELTVSSESKDGGAGAHADRLYLRDENGNVLPDADSEWNTMFEFKNNMGSITLNGAEYSIGEIKNPNVLYVAFDAVTTGDCITIEGVVVNEEKGLQYSFEKSSFVWTGSYWVKGSFLNEFKINENLTTKIGLYVETNESSPFDGDEGWDEQNAISYLSGNGITVDGEPISYANRVKFVGANIYIDLGDAPIRVGSVLKLGGLLKIDSIGVVYSLSDTVFWWTGTTWQKGIEVGKAQSITDATANGGYVHFENSSLPIGSWDIAGEYCAGIGVVVDGVTKNLSNTLKSLNSSIHVDGLGASSGSIFAIGGVFHYQGTVGDVTYDVYYIIEESAFKLDGSDWKVFSYTKKQLYEVVSNSGVNEVYLSFKSADLPVNSGDVAFGLFAGHGISVDGVQISMENSVKSVNDTLYVNLGNATIEKGSTLKIEGQFLAISDKGNFVYEIWESLFTYDGEKWGEYDSLKTYELGALTVSLESNSERESSTDSCIYLDSSNYTDDEIKSFVDDWSHFYTTPESGDGLKVNGTKASLSAIQSTSLGLYLAFDAVNVGDVITISGTFEHSTANVKYVISQSSFEWNGSYWVKVYNDDELEYYDVVTIIDLNQPTKETVEGTYDGSSLTYAKSKENTTGSIKFRLGYNSTDLSKGDIAIRLRYEAWTGYKFVIESGVITFGISDTGALMTTQSGLFSVNSDCVLEFGAIDMTDGNVWIYISVDGKIYNSTVVTKDDDTKNYTTNRVSVYFNGVASTTVFDPDHVKVTYNHSDGKSFYEYAPRKGEYTLASARSTGAFIGWDLDGSLYGANEVYTTGDDDLIFTAVELDFKMIEGASILISNGANQSGIKFEAQIDQEDLNNLISTYRATVQYGMLIVPYDYLRYNQAPNLDDFSTSGTTTNKDLIVKLPSNKEVKTVENGYIVYRGAMRNMYESNFERLFAGRGYIEITIGEKTITVYTPFDVEDNVRSIKNVALKYQGTSGSGYESLDSDKKAVIDAYANKKINLTNYSKYQANGFFSATAWYHPELNESNGYNNETNIAIATKMKEAGIKVVYLDGMYHLTLDTQVNIEKTRQIIEFFWSQGIYTIAYGGGVDFSGDIQYPDFSDCEGFMGFLVWDEPTNDDMEKLVLYAQNFEKIYAGSGVTFMANLLPSYASGFADESAYKSYLESYVNTVLSKVSGEKWLSMDSYPINADGTLTSTFLFDLAMLKYYSLSAGATSHAVLQSSGWTEGDNVSKYAMPTEAQLKMQAYTAMAFGIDSISWWSYSDKREDNQNNPTDSEDYYNRFKNANTELANVSAIYKAFNWKGVILGTGTDNGEALSSVSGDIGNYELTVNETKNLSSVTKDNAFNYLMGVMEDMNGNEGYVLVNYNDFTADKSQTITITFTANVTEVIIYQGGVATTQTVTNKTLAVTLTTGEGVIILPSQIG